MTETEGEKTVSTAEAEYKNVMSQVESGNAEFKTRLAWFKLSGRGGATKDEDGAALLLEERVKENDKEAMWMLGLCCEYGMGCKKDFERAKTLYKQSCDSGSVAGCFLAWNQTNGSGVMKVECL